MTRQVNQNMKSEEDNSLIANLTNTLRTDCLSVLKNQIIPFWLSMRDNLYGGFYGLLDFDLNLNKQADKGVIQGSRILYFFSDASISLKSVPLAEAAEHAYKFMTKYCFDETFGGVYWSVTFDGKPSDTVKHTYNQAFAIYALSSYYALSKNPLAIDKALQLFYLIESKCKDSYGYLESFNRDFTPSQNDKLSENNVIASRTMNTLLHVFEGYSALYRQTKNSDVKNALLGILDIYRKHVFNNTLNRQEVFFDSDYNSLIDLHSYGHDIESSWLIEQGCQLLDDNSLISDISSICDKLAKNIFDTAYINSSVCNEMEKGKLDSTRVWWVQSEAVVGFFNMWQKYPEQTQYLYASIRIFRYIQNFLVDKRPNSEWFWAVDKDGLPLNRFNIADQWKCPYHNGRMCLEILRRTK